MNRHSRNPWTKADHDSIPKGFSHATCGVIDTAPSAEPENTAINDTTLSNPSEKICRPTMAYCSFAAPWIPR